MKNRILIDLSLVGILLVISINTTLAQTVKPRVLVFFKTMGFKHASIPVGTAGIKKLGEGLDFDVDTTSNASLFTDDNLKNYKAVIFNNTTGNVLDNMQQQAFEKYIRTGGGYVGIHAAADTEYDWPWYGKLVGAYFESHPAGVHPATVEIIDKKHPATSGFNEQRLQRTDEWYNYKSISPDIKVLATLGEKSYEGGKNGTAHPIIWYHDFNGGRLFTLVLDIQMNRTANRLF